MLDEEQPRNADPSEPEPSAAGPTVVGIGASAGGLAALKTFFDRVPADSGLAYVVVVHLSPEHKSHLADVLQPHVRFPVQQVAETTALEPNHVYVIPPNANLSAIDTHLRLSKLEVNRRERAPIDHFFRTLAGAHDGRAIGVVLSGTGSDGTLGIKDIKAKGGLILVQDPNEAEYDGMPQSAIATGLVDRVLNVADIPEAIRLYHQTKPRVPLVDDGREAELSDRVILQKIFAQLRARTDRDFSRYKRSTILRRIARRMQLNYIEDLAAYLDKLQDYAEESRALADDLLVTVTSFFRDTVVFEKLEKEVIPKLFDSKKPEDSLRVWSVGCATGEEAYSLGMLLVEEAGRRESPPQIQIFASDLHKVSLDKAREGFYPGDIQTEVSAERLQRFFQKESGGYRINKDLRDLIVFAPHNLLGDPPFSRLDLIACRNLLIYLQRDVQRGVIELFHYALNPNGVLLLGASETVEDTDLFRIEDKKLCFYRKRNVPAPEPRLPVFPMTRVRQPGDIEHRGGQATEPLVYGSMHQRMVERYAPPSLLISPDNKLVHLSEHGGRYLVHPGGELTANVFKLVREELCVELRASLQTARTRKQPCDSKPILVRFNGHPSPVVLHVRPALEPEQDGFVLVIFEEREPQTSVVPEEESAADRLSDQRLQDLQTDLSEARQRLQSVIEEYETSQEEMRASNEEMQSTNEELRSTMEELETSKEELQSINEELQTVNQENRHKVEELAQLSSDLNNLLSATNIATLFLDRDLRILRFTPKLGELFNVRITDRGRLISDLTHRLGYDELRSDAETVLGKLVPIEREVQDESGRWYLTRVLPYRSTEDRIEGLVITFIDITKRLKAEESLRLSEEALRVSNESLLRANEDLKQFAIAASHDLQEPLRTVSNYSQLLVDASQAGNHEQARKAAGYVTEGTSRMRQLLDDLLAYTQLNAGNQEPAENVDLNAALASTMESLKTAIVNSDARVTADALPVVRGRMANFLQLFQNLIENAIKYRSDQPPRVHVSAQQVDGYWRIAVADNGLGIDAAYHGYIFGVFKRLDSELPGTGMGLAICGRIVERAGGRIWVESQPGRGSTFYFTLPAANDAAVTAKH